MITDQKAGKYYIYEEDGKEAIILDRENNLEQGGSKRMVKLGASEILLWLE